MTTQPEALSLADYLDLPHVGQHRSAAELRRQHAEIERLREVGVGYSQQTMDAVVREREKLREVNAELLEALRQSADLAEYWFLRGDRRNLSESEHKTWHALGYGSSAYKAARAAIEKAEGVKPPRIEGYNTNRDQPTVTIKEVKP